MNFNNIPNELRHLDQWVLWGIRKKNPKIPMSVNGGNASTTNSSTWASFSRATKAFDKIGFVFTKEDPYIGIDLDDCFNEESLKEWAEEIVQKFNGAYIEKSPSGKGLHIICKGEIPKSQKFNVSKKEHIELYSFGRYFTMTADVTSKVESIPEKQEGLDWLQKKYEKKKPSIKAKTKNKTEKKTKTEAQKKKTTPVAKRAKWVVELMKKLESQYGTLPTSNKDGWIGAICSPLREEKNPSFGFHPELQIWNDFSGGNGPLSDIAKIYDIKIPKSLPTGWKKRLHCKIKKDGSLGEVLNDSFNATLILLRDENWKGVFAFDEFQNNIVLLKEFPPLEIFGLAKYEKGRVIEDSDLFTVKCWFNDSEYHLRFSTDTIAGAIKSAGNYNAFHPLKDFLDELVWDKVPRLDQWLLNYMKAKAKTAKEKKYLTLIGPKWMIQAVARIYQPGCKADYVLILEGEQGINKSAALKKLAGEPYFSDTSLHIGKKDAYLSLQGTWIYEMGELDALMRAESSAAKTFFTSTHDKFRPPYGRFTVTIPRQCVFAGTVNEDDYMKDSTGGRRYWPVRCETIDLKKLAAAREQLWAEAVERYKAGEKWWPESKNEHKLCKEAQELRIFTDPWETKISEYIQGKKEVTIGSILEKGLNKETQFWNKSDEMRVGKLMRQWGWKRKRRWNKEKTSQMSMYVLPKKSKKH